MVTTLAHDEQIVQRHDIPGSMVRWNTLGTGGVLLLDPGDPPPWTTYTPGLERVRENLTIAEIGFPSIQWVIPLLTVALWNFLDTNYNHGHVTMRTSIDGVAYANYNATFNIETRNEMRDRWNLFSSSPYVASGYEGWGWQQAIITFTGMEAI